MKTTMSAGYYRTIYERFGGKSSYPTNTEETKPNSDDGKTSSQNISECAFNNLSFCMPPPPKRISNHGKINVDKNKKRDIKDKLKENQSIIDSFIQAKSNLICRSITIYRHVWEDFVKFSLSIDPNAVSDYIRWKFKLDPNLTDQEITLEGTSLKYESILVQFFNYIGNKIQRNFNRKYIFTNILGSLS